MEKANRDKGVKILLDTDIYPVEAIFGASYVFADRAYIYMDKKKDGCIEINMKSKKNISQKEITELEGEFMNELLQYVVRINLLKYNKKIREDMIERALFSGLEDDDEGENDFKLEDDTLGIAVPWDEKFGDKKNKKNKSKKNKKK